MAMLVVVAVAAAIEVGSTIYRLMNRPKLKPPVGDLQISAAIEGSPLTFGWGRVRVAGSLTWTWGLKVTEAGIPGGGGGSNFGGGGTQFLFFSDCYFEFCEGPGTILRMWGDSKLIYDSTPGTSEYPPDNFPAWSADTLYNIGDIVSFAGSVFTCEQENTGVTPGQTADQTGGILYWMALGSYQPWDIDQTYNPGDVVIDNGQLYVNIQTTTAPAHTVGNDHYWVPLAAYYGDFTFYPGNQTQLPDPLVQASEGVDNTPANRGVVGVSIRNFRLANFGNRIPNLRAEVSLGKGSGPVIWQSAETDGVGPGSPYLSLNLPIESTDFLIACGRFRPDGGGAPNISDDAGNDWGTPIVVSDNRAVWICSNPVPSTSLLINLLDNAGGFDYDFGFCAAVIRGAVSETHSSASGGPGTLSVSNDGASLSVVSNVDFWAAVMFTFLDENGERLDVMAACFHAPSDFQQDVSDQGFNSLFAPHEVSIAVTGTPTNRLSEVVLDVCERAGLDSSMVDVSLLTSGNIFPNDIVQGYAITRPTSAGEILKTLFQAYFFDACETDGTIRFVPRGMPAAITIPEEDLGLLADGAKINPEELGQAQDLPREITVLYNDISMDYQQGKQLKQRSSRVVKTRQQETIELAISTDKTFARQVSEKTLFLRWLERSGYTLNLWRALYMLLDPTDVIQFIYKGATFKMRAVDTLLGQGFAVTINGVSDNEDNYLSNAVGGAGSGFVPQPLLTNAPTLLFLFDIPLLRDSDSNPGLTGLYGGLTSVLKDWPGGVIFRSSDNANFDAVDNSAIPLNFGYATNALGVPRSPWTWDKVNTLNVKMSLGTLIGTSDLNVLNGANAFLVGSPTLGWEAIQAQSITLETDGSYTLSRLLRGRRGTEVNCGSHAIGDLVVPLPTGMKHDKDSLAIINQLRYYKGVTAGQDPSGVASQRFTNTGNDLRPYAPVHIHGSRDVDKNITMTWIRRTRIGGTWLDSTGTVPLSEDSELYDVEILNGSTVVRTFLDVDSPTLEYDAEDQATDFGSLQAQVSVRVFQKGTIGRGFAGTATV